MSPADFIEVFPDALPRDACAALIARFEASGQDVPGRIGASVDPSIKLSRDIWLGGSPAWADAEEMLNRAMFHGLVAYVRKHPFALLAPLSFECTDPDSGERRALRHDDVARLDNHALANLILSSLRPGQINLQRYTADVGGYPGWHCEQAPTDVRAEALHRTLLWTIYLNDDFSAGETEFFHQQRKIVPRTGSLLIAPTAFTHTHRGNRPLGADKYIATSWVLFQRAEALLAAQQPAS